MTEKPILFSGPMVRAIREDRKTQTRRKLRDQSPARGWYLKGGFFVAIPVIEKKRYLRSWPDPIRVPYAVGDVLWVRERFNVTCFMGDDCTITYVADKRSWPTGPNCGHIPDDKLAAYFRMIDTLRGKAGGRDFPSIHMPRWASRLTLRVTAVKVERLQDICMEDALAEGVHPDEQNWNATRVYGGSMPVHLFGMLWESINGPGSWDANPWVAAYSFERLT